MIAHHHDGHLFYWCDGCKHSHSVPSFRWHWNGSLDSPTLSPSVRHFYRHPDTNAEVTTCHYFIKDGLIQYCGDCKHELKGQTLPLSPIPESYGLPGRPAPSYPMCAACLGTGTLEGYATCPNCKGSGDEKGGA